MYKEVLRAAEGTEIFACIALVIFFSFFVGMLLWCLKADKGQMRRAAMLPLEADPSPITAGAKENV